MQAFATPSLVSISLIVSCHSTALLSCRYCYIDPHHHELVYLPRDPHNFGHPLDDVKTRAKAKRQVEKDDWGNPKGFQPGLVTKARIYSLLAFDA